MSRPIPRISITLPNGATAEVAATKISNNQGVYSGTLSMMKVVTPNFTNAITVTIKIYDRNSILLYTSAALAENSGAGGYAIPLNIPLTYGEVFSATPSGDPGAGGGIVTIDCDYIPD